MERGYIDEAVELLEKANADLEPELLTAPQARELLESYARARRLVDYGVAALAGRIDDSAKVAKATGTPLGRAKETVTTGKVLDGVPELDGALRHGDISLDQATEIARALSLRSRRGGGAAPGGDGGAVPRAEREVPQGQARSGTASWVG